MTPRLWCSSARSGASSSALRYTAIAPLRSRAAIHSSASRSSASRSPATCPTPSRQRCHAQRHCVTPPAPREPEERQRVARQHDREGKPETARRVEPESAARRVDDESDSPLGGETADEHQQVERRVCARRELAGEALVQHRVREYVRRGAEAIKRPPRLRARELAEDRGKSARIQCKADAEQVLRSESATGKSCRKETDQEIACEHHDAHEEQMAR